MGEVGTYVLSYFIFNENKYFLYKTWLIFFFLEGNTHKVVDIEICQNVSLNLTIFIDKNNRRENISINFWLMILFLI